MAITTRRAPNGHRPTFAELFTPKLVTVLREGYGFADFRADAIAGLTVAIVALPLSMAIAIASGGTPDRGLTTAVIGGFIVSLLGGSRFQIGGPAGAFIVLVALTAERHGVDGVILATLMAGVILIAAGTLRHLYQIHSLSGDGGIHRRDRRHHLRQPDQGSVRHYAAERAGRTGSEIAGDRGRAAYRQFLRGRSGCDQHRHHRRLKKTSAGLARHSHRSRRHGNRGVGAIAAGANNRHAVRGHSAGLALAGMARVLAGKGEGRAARRDSAANAMSRVAAKAQRQGIKLFITGASPPVRRALLTHGVRPPRAKFRATIARAVSDIKGDQAVQPVAKAGLAAG